MFIKFFIGLVSGICTGLGIGGGSVLILCLSFFLGFEQHVAQATNILFFIPAAIISILLNFKNKNINIKNSIPIILFGILGSIVGSNISKNLNMYLLRKLFGFFLILVCVKEIYSFYNLYINNKIRHTKSSKKGLVKK